MSKSIYSKDQINLASKLKEAREKAKFDQKEVAKLLGKSQSYISKVESGQRRVDVIELKEFARIYKKELNSFLREK